MNSQIVQKTLDLISKMEENQKEELIDNIGDLIEMKKNRHLRKAIQVLSEIEPKNCDAETLLQALKNGNRKTAKIIPDRILYWISSFTEEIANLRNLNENLNREIEKIKKSSVEEIQSNPEDDDFGENDRTEEILTAKIINDLNSLIDTANELIETKISGRNEYLDGLAYTLSTGKRIY